MTKHTPLIAATLCTVWLAAATSPAQPMMQFVSEGEGAEAIAPPEGLPSGEAEEIAGEQTVVKRQLTPPAPTGPIATYDAEAGAWIPTQDDRPNGWLRELAIPQNLLDCRCDGVTPATGCRLWRSFVRPTDPSIDQDCVSCVKEPCLTYEPVQEVVEVVVYKCVQVTEQFEDCDCQGGQCVQTQGTRRVQKLHPCKVRVPLRYNKPVIRYRDVYYYLDCCSQNNQAAGY